MIQQKQFNLADMYDLILVAFLKKKCSTSGHNGLCHINTVICKHVHPTLVFSPAAPASHPSLQKSDPTCLHTQPTWWTGKACPDPASRNHRSKNTQQAQNKWLGVMAYVVFWCVTLPSPRPINHHWWVYLWPPSPGWSARRRRRQSRTGAAWFNLQHETRRWGTCGTDTAGCHRHAFVYGGIQKVCRPGAGLHPT